MEGWLKKYGHWTKIWGRGHKRVTSDVTRHLPESMAYPESIHVRIDAEHKDGDVATVLRETAVFVEWLKAQ